MRVFYAIVSTIIIALVMPSLCVGSDVRRSIAKFVGDSTLAHASVGVSVMDIMSGEVIGEINGQVSHIPASTMKTITSATALCLLGEEYTFHTKVYIDGKIESNGTLNGNIRIVGGGDPTLGSKWCGFNSFINACIDAVKSRGIKKIKGDIILDSSIFPAPAISPLWMVDDIACDYGAGAFGINFADNTFDLSLDVAGDSAVVISIAPIFVDVAIDNHLKMYDKKGVDDENNIELMVGDRRNVVSIYGTVVRDAKPVALTCSNPHPEKLLRDSLLIVLANSSVRFNKKRKADLEESELILDYTSPELSKILNSMLVRSDNMYTECVLRALALHEGLEATASNGVKVVKKYWHDKGLDVRALFMKDGSGLARNNKVSSRFLVEMLALMAKDNSLQIPFHTLFPIAGKNGTVTSLLKATDYAGQFAVKSGSMDDVQCFTGYFPAESPKYVVAILVNNYNCPRRMLIKNIEKLLISIFSEIKIN